MPQDLHLQTPNQQTKMSRPSPIQTSTWTSGQQRDREPVAVRELEPHQQQQQQVSDGPGKLSLPLHRLKARATVVHQSIYGMMLDTREAQELCKSLGLTPEHVYTMKRRFNKFDIYHSGEITRDEFLTLINEEKRELTQGIFKFAPFLQPTQKYLKFDDFVFCTCTFAAMTREELYRYAFDLFDVDKSGFLEQEEFHKLSESLQTKRFCFPKNLQAALQVLERANNAYDPLASLIDFKDFIRINEVFPLAFYPILNMQNCVRQHTLGTKFWMRVSDKRLKIELLVKYLERNLGRLPKETWLERFWNLFSSENAEIRIKALEKYNTKQGIKSDQPPQMGSPPGSSPKNRPIVASATSDQPGHHKTSVQTMPTLQESTQLKQGVESELPRKVSSPKHAVVTQELVRPDSNSPSSQTESLEVNQELFRKGSTHTTRPSTSQEAVRGLRADNTKAARPSTSQQSVHGGRANSIQAGRPSTSQQSVRGDPVDTQADQASTISKQSIQAERSPQSIQSNASKQSLRLECPQTPGASFFKQLTRVESPQPSPQSRPKQSPRPDSSQALRPSTSKAPFRPDAAKLQRPSTTQPSSRTIPTKSPQPNVSKRSASKPPNTGGDFVKHKSSTVGPTVDDDLESNVHQQATLRSPSKKQLTRYSKTDEAQPQPKYIKNLIQGNSNDDPSENYSASTATAAVASPKAKRSASKSLTPLDGKR